MKFLNILLVLTGVWNCETFVTHPLVHVGPLTIFEDPHLCQDAPKFTAAVPLWASEFDLNIILLRFHSLEAPLFQLLLGEETKLLFFCVRRTRFGGINTEEAHSLTSTDIKAKIKGNINRISIYNLLEG